MVVARRYPRIDSRFNRLQSRLFHGIVRRLTRTDFHDVSCGFKVMKRRVGARSQPLRRAAPLHPAAGGPSRLHGARDPGPAAAGGPPHPLPRHADLPRTPARHPNIFFLTKFTRTPLRFFGLLGAALFSLGFVIDLIVAVEKVFFSTGLSDRALLLLGVLLMVLGVQTLSLGLVGEIIIFTHARNVREYKVAEVISSPARPELARVGDGRTGLDGALQAS